MERPVDCAICYEKLRPDEKALQCGHVFHDGCVEKLRQMTCPLCRKPIQNKNGTFSFWNENNGWIPLNPYDRNREEHPFFLQPLEEDKNFEEVVEDEEETYRQRGYNYPDEDPEYDEENPRGDEEDYGDTEEEDNDEEENEDDDQDE